MARIANVLLPLKKRVPIALQKIYGIGNTLSHQICKKAKITTNNKISDLTEKEIITLRNIIEEEYKTEGDLKREIFLNIKRKKDTKSYQGLRHVRKLPVRGQNTHSNARTRKGKTTSSKKKK